MIGRSSYIRRRENLLSYLGGCSALVMCHPSYVRNGDTEYPYRQNSFMHYLTGFDEPECALLVLGHRPKGDRFYMFLRERDKLGELWTGKRLGVEAAPEALGVDKAFCITELWDMLPELLLGTEGLYYSFGKYQQNDIKLIEVLSSNRMMRGRTRCGNLAVYDSEAIAGKMRIIKDKEEIESIREAARITQKAFVGIEDFIKSAKTEREIYAYLMKGYYSAGAERESFPSIVAAGVNSCCLHYFDNSSVVKKGDLVLLDTGIEYDYYASDVSRTYTTSTMSGAQKDIYDLVLKAQLASIKVSVKGSTLKKVHDESIRVLTEGLIDLGLLSGSVESNIETGNFKKFYPHNTSHFIGLDDHDIGDYVDEKGEPRLLEPGMYFSVEPGIYCDPNDETIPEKYRGIGVRIEDDVLVTESGNEVTTEGIAK